MRFDVTTLSLRFRIFLFFALLACGGVVLVLGALWVGHSRALDSGLLNGFLTAAILSAFGLMALSTGIWLLFDENIGKPIEALAAQLRVRAHAGVSPEIDPAMARYLGDLAPAVRALGKTLDDSQTSSAQDRDAEILNKDRDNLVALLSEIPAAIVLVNASGAIALYDGQAAEILAQIRVPRLNAPLSDYLDPSALAQAEQKMRRTGTTVTVSLADIHGQTRFEARLAPSRGGGYVAVLTPQGMALAPGDARPLVFDFDLRAGSDNSGSGRQTLSALTFVVFDTETTGLLPHKDDIVQIGAVRVLNGRIIEGEELDCLVDPGRPIPPSSTKVHGVTDAMVAGQPDILTIGRQFHDFTRGAVIVAHNAPFDMAFLHRHSRKLGVTWDNPILDTVLLSAVLFGASQTHTLDALCARLDVEIPKVLRHTALGDARATAEAFVRMLPMLEARGFTTLDAVLEQTRKHGRLLEDMN